MTAGLKGKHAAKRCLTLRYLGYVAGRERGNEDSLTVYM